MYDIINRREYRNFRINTGIYEEFYCYRQTLDQIIDIIEYMIKNHSKVLCLLFVITSPVELDVDIRKKMSRIIESLKRKIEYSYNCSSNKVDLCHVWRAEKNNGEHEHIHLAIIVNGNAIQNGWGIHSHLNDVVRHLLQTDKDGLVHFCASNGHYGKMINRNSQYFQDQINDAVYAMSYIAKARPSDQKNKYARLSSASRFPRKTR